MHGLNGVYRQRAQNGYDSACLQLTTTEVVAAERQARDWQRRRRATNLAPTFTPIQVAP